jgi:tRNA threonylcarbamoyladenosine biosynthesis protein TsaB
MLILGIETATPWGTMALCDNDDIIFEVTIKIAKGGGEYLLATLNQLLQKVGKDIKDIELIVVGTGPGSYTGVRVGMATAQGLATSLNVPIKGINTLRIIAENYRNSSKWIAVAIDARREEVYAALYESTAEGLIEVIAPAAMTVRQFAEQCRAYDRVIICGDAGKNYQQIWNEYPNFAIAPVYGGRPSAVLAIQIIYQNPHYQEGDRVLTPSYLRRVEAEVRLEERLNAGNRGANDH